MLALGDERAAANRRQAEADGDPAIWAAQATLGAEVARSSKRARSSSEEEGEILPGSENYTLHKLDEVDGENPPSKRQRAILSKTLADSCGRDSISLSEFANTNESNQDRSSDNEKWLSQGPTIRQQFNPIGMIKTPCIIQVNNGELVGSFKSQVGWSVTLLLSGVDTNDPSISLIFAANRAEEKAYLPVGNKTNPNQTHTLNIRFRPGLKADSRDRWSMMEYRTYEPEDTLDPSIKRPDIDSEVNEEGQGWTMAFVFDGCDFQGRHIKPDPTIWGRYEESGVKDAIDQIWQGKHNMFRIWIAQRLTLKQRISVLGFQLAINCRFSPFQAPGAPAQTGGQFRASLEKERREKVGASGQGGYGQKFTTRNREKEAA